MYPPHQLYQHHCQSSRVLRIYFQSLMEVSVVTVIVLAGVVGQSLRDLSCSYFSRGCYSRLARSSCLRTAPGACYGFRPFVHFSRKWLDHKVMVP